MIDSPSNTAVHAVEAKGLTIQFRLGRRKRLTALDGVDLSIPRGDIFGLLGQNGAGKSTAMYCFLGMLQPKSGTVHLFGEKPYPGAPVFENITYLPEEPHYHPYLTVEELVTYYGSLYQKSITDNDISKALEYVGLEQHRTMRLAKCSKGMKQKAGLAACMLFRPEILFLDEPTRGLDPIMVRKFRDYILKINKQGTTVILNSHILSEVEMVCSKVAIMERGKIIAHDTLENLVQSVDDEYEVVTDASPELPGLFRDREEASGIVTGYVSGPDLEEMIRICRSKSIVLRSCRLRVESLEDVFMRVVEDS